MIKINYHPREIHNTIEENKRLKKTINAMQENLINPLPLTQQKVVTKEIVKDCDHLKVIHSLEDTIGSAKKRNNDAITKLEHILSQFQDEQLILIQNHIKQLRNLF